MFKKIFSDSIVYGAGRIIMMVVSIFLVPIYSHKFSRSDYGVIETFNMFINMMMLIMPCGITQSMFQLVYKIKDNEGRKAFFSTILQYYILICIIFLFISIIGNAFFIKILISDTQYVKIFIFSCITIVFQLINNYNLDIFRCQFKKTHYFILSVGSAITLAMSGIVTVIYLDLGVRGFFYASAFTHILFGFLGLALNRGWFNFTFSSEKLKQLLQIGLPYIPAGLSLVLMNFIDRIIVQRILGLNELGLYAMALKLSALFDIIGTAFANAWFPWAMKIAADVLPKETFRLLFLKILGVLSLAALFLAICAKWILHILIDIKFWECAPVIFFLIFASLINYSNFVLGIGIYASGKTKYIAIPTIAGGIINVIGCILLTRIFGLYGVVCSVIFGSLTYVIVSTIISEKVYPIKFPLKTGILILLVLCINFVLINIIDTQNYKWTFDALLKCSLFLVNLFFIFSTKLFNLKEVVNILHKRIKLLK